MKTYDIGVVPGEGTGAEVTAEAVKALNALSETGGPQFNFTDYDIGGERYLSKGELLPESVLSELRDVDAILLGAIGHPEVKQGILEKDT